MSPLYWGIGALGLLSVLFEPLREALWELGEAVGGVGGVGGLTNQYGPTPTCNTTEDLIGTNDTAPYCFHPGFSGFTPFGGLTILLATVPLAVLGFTGFLSSCSIASSSSFVEGSAER